MNVSLAGKPRFYKARGPGWEARDYVTRCEEESLDESYGPLRNANPPVSLTSCVSKNPFLLPLQFDQESSPPLGATPSCTLFLQYTSLHFLPSLKYQKKPQISIVKGPRTTNPHSKLIIFFLTLLFFYFFFIPLFPPSRCNSMSSYYIF